MHKVAMHVRGSERDNVSKQSCFLSFILFSFLFCSGLLFFSFFSGGFPIFSFLSPRTVFFRFLYVFSVSFLFSTLFRCCFDFRSITFLFFFPGFFHRFLPPDFSAFFCAPFFNTYEYIRVEVRKCLFLDLILLLTSYRYQ